MNTWPILKRVHNPELSQSKIPTGNLLSNLEEAMLVKVLEQRYIKCPLVVAKEQFARKVQIWLERISYYDIEIGRFIRISKGKGMSKPGPMGTLLSQGYIQVQLHNYKFVQSHLVCLWFLGKLPNSDEQMDHISGDRSDDRPENLRLVTHTLNARNHKMHKDNTTGYTGVYLNRAAITNPYTSSIRIDGENKYFGVFPTPEEAYAARQVYLNAHPELGFTARHGT